MPTELSLSSVNTVTVTLYIVGSTASDIITRVTEIISKESYTIIDSSSNKKGMFGMELLTYFVDNLTISSGLPHNDYGQTVKVVFSLKKKHLLIKNTLVMGS